LFAVKGIGYTGTIANDTFSTLSESCSGSEHSGSIGSATAGCPIRSVITLVTDVDKGCWCHSRVAHWALSIAFLTQPTYSDSWLFAAKNQIGMVSGSSHERMKGGGVCPGYTD
jgi:hypothetical protein